MSCQSFNIVCDKKFLEGSNFFDKLFFYCCAARSAFGRRAEPERSEGGWSEAQPNGEGVASGSATEKL